MCMRDSVNMSVKAELYESMHVHVTCLQLARSECLAIVSFANVEENPGADQSLEH